MKTFKLEPYECQFCDVRVSWALIRGHEAVCKLNPANRCAFCRRSCVEFSLNPECGLEPIQQRRQHEISCRFHPRNLSEVEVNAILKHKTTLSAKAAVRLEECLIARDYECLHCRELHPGHMLGLHERNCSENPTNQCEHCGAKFEGAGNVCALERVKYHKSLCKRVPSNIATCPYCNKEYFSSSECSARSALERHEGLCPENPRLKCEYCSKAFRPFGRIPVESMLARHKRICPERPHNVEHCRYCDKEYRSTTTTSAQALVKRHEYICPAGGADTKSIADRPSYVFEQAMRLRRSPRYSGTSSQVSSRSTQSTSSSASSSSSGASSSGHRNRLTQLPTFSDRRRRPPPDMYCRDRYHYSGTSMRPPYYNTVIDARCMQEQTPTGGDTWRSPNDYIRISDEKQTNETTIFDMFMRTETPTRPEHIPGGAGSGECGDASHWCPCAYSGCWGRQGGCAPWRCSQHTDHLGRPLNTVTAARSDLVGLRGNAHTRPGEEDNGVHDAAELEIRAIRSRLNLIEKSSSDEARQEVRRLQLQWHPDKTGSDPVRQQIAKLVYPAVQEMWKRFV